MGIGDWERTYNGAEKNNGYCAGDHDCIARLLSMAWSCELQIRKPLVGSKHELPDK